uniref:Uncharacterized protein n=1 Tax=Chromera velia CCMP2878 TaxID=1169474 RepID=A0A0G4G8R9_9ALVE|eukprot:Cvel_4307.t1-p1 / transcript=Cvel_4307.t1 / gene=Cvel_4307 / organism=Chromera_velia_CCMP2878 / gene_product=hypothetical protein / transcript_product=hypothetical protein / location=Cvel_scaffold187:1947-2924(+) / protein_length=145 / sequence_SO=supercontig / SO=protein_coding / is_pseudo=false
MGEHIWNSEEALSGLDRTPYGKDLARSLADALVEAKAWSGDEPYIGYVHRDYCGYGVGLCKDTFWYGPLECDGWPVKSEDAEKSWKSADEFVDWLAQQSNYSLSGVPEAEEKGEFSFSVNNQRMNKGRIEQFIKETAEKKAKGES